MDRCLECGYIRVSRCSRDDCAALLAFLLSKRFWFLLDKAELAPSAFVARMTVLGSFVAKVAGKL